MKLAGLEGQEISGWDGRIRGRELDPINKYGTSCPSLWQKWGFELSFAGGRASEPRQVSGWRGERKAGGGRRRFWGGGEGEEGEGGTEEPQIAKRGKKKCQRRNKPQRKAGNCFLMLSMGKGGLHGRAPPC